MAYECSGQPGATDKGAQTINESIFVLLQNRPNMHDLSLDGQDKIISCSACRGAFSVHGPTRGYYRVESKSLRPSFSTLCVAAFLAQAVGMSYYTGGQ